MPAWCPFPHKVHGGVLGRHGPAQDLAIKGGRQPEPDGGVVAGNHVVILEPAREGGLPRVGDVEGGGRATCQVGGPEVEPPGGCKGHDNGKTCQRLRDCRSRAAGQSTLQKAPVLMFQNPYPEPPFSPHWKCVALSEGQNGSGRMQRSKAPCLFVPPNSMLPLRAGTNAFRSHSLQVHSEAQLVCRNAGA